MTATFALAIIAVFSFTGARLLHGATPTTVAVELLAVIAFLSAWAAASRLFMHFLSMGHDK